MESVDNRFTSQVDFKSFSWQISITGRKIACIELNEDHVGTICWYFIPVSCMLSFPECVPLNRILTYIYTLSMYNVLFPFKQHNIFYSLRTQYYEQAFVLLNALHLDDILILFHIYAQTIWFTCSKRLKLFCIPIFLF